MPFALLADRKTSFSPTRTHREVGAFLLFSRIKLFVRTTQSFSLTFCIPHVNVIPAGEESFFSREKNAEIIFVTLAGNKNLRQRLMKVTKPNFLRRFQLM